eukprot:13129750-Heterocapsa_arctica.AAC.1
MKEQEKKQDQDELDGEGTQDMEVGMNEQYCSACAQQRPERGIVQCEASQPPREQNNEPLGAFLAGFVFFWRVLAGYFGS